jgi:hypothetical protein
MPKTDYSNREIDALIQTVITKIDDYASTDKLAHASTKETLDRIETQTVRTNGRVSKLERWQSYVIGFCACVVLILLPVLFLVAQIFSTNHP